MTIFTTRDGRRYTQARLDRPFYDLSPEEAALAEENLASVLERAGVNRSNIILTIKIDPRVLEAIERK